MSKISSFGRFLDQPVLISKLEQKIPTVLTLAGVAFTAKETMKSPPEERTKTALKTAIILSATIFSAIKAPKIADLLIKRSSSINQGVPQISEKINSKFEQTLNNNFNTICEIIQTTPNLTKESIGILNKSKSGNVLTLNEVSTLRKNLNKVSFNKLIPEPEAVTSKDIFKEIGWLSIFGAVPVLGGILGGITADMVTENDWKKRIDNKVKEGIYQYLANIFMCNVGAGSALFVLEKMGIKSKAARCIGMVTGIILTGVIGGSYIANTISNKIINPLLKNNKSTETRKPEMIDIGLHTDDIATVAVLSGLKWIEPALPLLYTVSGYRAGIGYRNDVNNQADNKNINPKSSKFEKSPQKNGEIFCEIC